MQQTKVVLIDDENLMRITTSMLLKHHGFEIATAANGVEGLSLVREQLPGVVLLDIMMPEMDGWEVLRQLKADDRTRNIEVIIFTACDLPVPDDIREKYGNFAMLRKPFHIEQLLEAVHKKEPGNG
jgi:CheY-like chemotaxis protein